MIAHHLHGGHRKPIVPWVMVSSRSRCYGPWPTEDRYRCLRTARAPRSGALIAGERRPMLRYFQQQNGEVAIVSGELVIGLLNHADDGREIVRATMTTIDKTTTLWESQLLPM